MTDYDKFDLFGIPRDGVKPKRNSWRKGTPATLARHCEVFAKARPDCDEGEPFYTQEFFDATRTSYYREAAIEFAKSHGMACFEIKTLRGYLFARNARQAADKLAQSLHLVQYDA